MDGISSTPVENSVQFLRLRDKYKSDLLDDSRLTKAAGLAAQQELLLESPAPDTWKEPRFEIRESTVTTMDQENSSAWGYTLYRA